ncbi:MAG: hypothetical protein ACTHOR_05265 [Devosia sp.]
MNKVATFSLALTIAALAGTSAEARVQIHFNQNGSFSETKGGNQTIKQDSNTNHGVQGAINISVGSGGGSQSINQTQTVNYGSAPKH